MSQPRRFDVIIIGGGPIGLSSAHEVAKAGSSVLLLESAAFFNAAGSSGDLVRMFRTMYTEDFMADLAYDAIKIWKDLERDSGENLILMSGLLNFGDPNYGAGGPEGTLEGPIPNLQRLDMTYEWPITKDQIESRYPFKNLPTEWKGLFAPDNGCINVPLLLRTLYSLAQSYGAVLKQYTRVNTVIPYGENSESWLVSGSTIPQRGEQIAEEVQYIADKIIITAGAYSNHIVKPSFDFELDLNIWEMVYSYWTLNATPDPQACEFPSMWFQFANDDGDKSQLFYGFPALPWGTANTGRIAVDAATRQITDPIQRASTTISPEDLANTQEFVRNHVRGADSTVPIFSGTCLQTNVYDNMFVLDFIPAQYLKGGKENSIAIFTAGWAMKFVPLLGRALMQMALYGHSPFKLPEFSITRSGTGGSVIKNTTTLDAKDLPVREKRNYGSSLRH